ncbi:MAG TPA: outer membrane beta-barrel protein [Longimicrobium sp.]|nr:outer membrane beta-barrel protein [Longimicrobium sp.]
MKVRLFVAVALVTSSFSPAPAAAQLGSGGSDAGRLTLGVSLSGSQIASDAVANPTAPRGGLGLTVGYGISERVSAFVRGISGYQSTQVDLGVRYRFGGASQRLRPYVEGAVTAIGATGRTPFEERGEGLSRPTRSTGTGFTAGAGLEYFISPRLGVDLGVTHSLGRFGHPVETQFDRTFSATRLHVGLTWRP